MNRLANLLSRWLVVLALGLFVPAVSAQTELRLATLEISLWPEFDRAGVLVLLDGTLPAGATLPATLTLRLPSEPFAVAEADSGGSLLNADFQTAADGDDVVVTITLQRSTFRVEYYDEALTVAGSARTYAFAWAAPAARLGCSRRGRGGDSPGTIPVRGHRPAARPGVRPAGRGRLWPQLPGRRDRPARRW